MATDTDTGPELDHGHPSASQYVEIGIILAVLTAIEVALFYANIPRGITIPALLFLTAMKFVLVASRFMHLRFDNRLLRRLFIGGIALAAVIYGVVALIMFNQPIVTQV
jgi:cytochrome c oxidase subunit IV